ncbi:MAG: flagellar biosynthesis anti-sigma factor FlgM [Gammaproteobacteria bacterium]|nr:flagellar biosynthesis anti-sigma factor FlgM [Gammaproteobacteria bacterium]
MMMRDDTLKEENSQSKIEAIQKALREGTFKANAERIAENMLAMDRRLIKKAKRLFPEKV